MTEIDEILARNLKAYRRLRKLTQEALADQAGISTRTLQMVEQRKNWPTRETIRELARVLKISQVDLFAPNPPSKT